MRPAELLPQGFNLQLPAVEVLGILFLESGQARLWLNRVLTCCSERDLLQSPGQSCCTLEAVLRFRGNGLSDDPGPWGFRKP